MEDKKIQKILKSHKRWLNGKWMGKRANFMGQNLSNKNFKEANLIRADFEMSNLSGANFRGADLQSADFVCTDLRNADFRDAKLRDANFYLADLEGAKLSPVYQTRTQMSLSILRSQKGKLKAFFYTDEDDVEQLKIGKVYQIKKSECVYDDKISNGYGLKIAPLNWCLEKANYDIYKISYIEVEFDVKDIISIPYNSDGYFKVRKFKTSKVLTRGELKNHLLIK